MKFLTESNTKCIKYVENQHLQFNQELIKYNETKSEVVETENENNTANNKKDVEADTINKKIIVLYGLGEPRYESKYE